ncbi:MAG TPA: serine O-acetyltransferase [bacterium]|nr:serine O-acetyltransferase [bacterium]HOL47442.1 serine O-acetyltransferase [bacterium]HPQ19509.1 serine O-acetyltransferase [bacterium]
MIRKIKADWKAIFLHDPAAKNNLFGWIEVILTYSGFQAILLYRIAHIVYKLGIPILPRLISHFAKLLTGVEIHPAAEIDEGFFIDHGHGVVIGETTIIGKNVTIYQGVTLGGTGNQTGKRHPTIKDNVFIGAGAIILGNITINNNVKVGAGTVIVKDVPENSTIVGPQGVVVKQMDVRLPSYNLEYSNLPNPLVESFERIQKEIELIEAHMRCLNENDPNFAKKCCDLFNNKKLDNNNNNQVK